MRPPDVAPHLTPMPFRFALAPLLRLRQSVERQRALRLREASLKVTRLKETLAQLDRFLSASAVADQAGLHEGRRAAELQFATVFRENLESLRQRHERELQRLESERQKAAEEYQQAYRECEALDTLRQRQRRAYQQEELRRQQRTLDATHLFQRWRNPLG